MTVWLVIVWLVLGTDGRPEAALISMPTADLTTCLDQAEEALAGAAFAAGCLTAPERRGA